GEVKLPLVSRDLLPDMAILDSELLENLPKSLVADCGFDVLGHCLEAYTAQNANGFTDALALAAFRCVLENLSVSYSGDLSVRGKIHQAATMAGLSFSRAGLGLCHAMAHSLGGVFHIPHGRLVAMLLPPIITCGAKVCSEKYAALARGVGLPGAANVMAVRNLTNALVNLRKSLHMPGSLQEAGIAPAQVLQHKEQILRATLQDPCCATAPVPVDMMQVSQILEAVTGRG
ncbi:MAG: iron-containing alcohol dehydrogenase, partial [Oscillospiraceae bacterium]|nr:iron-containing alcohol dehydrogenase [Oscillospiraceae bacterium]